MICITGGPEWDPPFEHVEYGSPREVDSLEGPSGLDQAWAWEDEAEGLIRARVFVPGLGITEDEATGAYAIRLCARLGREISIRQGAGSRIQARPLSDGSVEIGGRVRTVEERDFKINGWRFRRGQRSRARGISTRHPDSRCTAQTCPLVLATECPSRIIQSLR